MHPEFQLHVLSKWIEEHYRIYPLCREDWVLSHYSQWLILRGNYRCLAEYCFVLSSCQSASFQQTLAFSFHSLCPSFALTDLACRHCKVHFAGRSAAILRGLRLHRLTNQWNGPLTLVFVWLRQASAQPQRPLISDVRRRREILPSPIAFNLGKRAL